MLSKLVGMFRFKTIGGMELVFPSVTVQHPLLKEHILPIICFED